MDQNELQYKGEKFSIRWDPREEMFFMKFWGDHEKSDAEDFAKNFFDIADRIPKTGAIYLLLDVSEQGKLNHEARRVYTYELAKRALPTYSAICGLNLVLRLAMGFILTVLKKKLKDVRSFATLEEGRKWLREMRAKEVSAKNNTIKKSKL